MREGNRRGADEGAFAPHPVVVDRGRRLIHDPASGVRSAA